MFAIKLNITQHVLTILDIDTKIQQLLLGQDIDYVRKFIHTKHDTNQLMV